MISAEERTRRQLNKREILGPQAGRQKRVLGFEKSHDFV
jgi:hypothetical protein